MFYVGQRVVCVDAGLNSQRFGVPPHIVTNKSLDGLAKGRVYTVRAVGPGSYSIPALWLQEISRATSFFSDGWVGEPGFASARFRPVVERKTDISIFTAMLNPSDKRVEA